MSGRYSVGIDVGTTGLKGLLVDEAGRVVKQASRGYRPSAPAPGWSEQDPDDWVRAAHEVLGELTAAAAAPIGAIGLSGQMHGSVFLDTGGRPLGPAILWNDQRTAAECEEIEARTDGRIREWTLNPPRTAFTATKILWWRRHRPEAYARTAAVLLPKDYVRYRLSGERWTDVADASGTLLLDVRRRRWSGETLDALEIPADLLPAVVECPEVAGQVSAEAAAATGLAEGTPIVGGGGDQAAAGIGNGVVRPGVLSITIGTSGVVYAQLGDELLVDTSGSFHTFCHAVPGTWQIMAGVLSAGGSFDWFQRAVAAGESFEALGRGIAEVPPGSGGLVFLPYLTGERSPHNDPEARGAWVGLTVRHDRRHMARAVIEGVCFALRDLVDGAGALGAPVEEVRVAGGGAQSPVWLGILADALDRPVHPALTVDASAYGAAALAMAAATGEDVAAIAARWVRTGPAVAPDPARAAAYADQYALFRNLYPATCPFMHRLGALERAFAEPGGDPR